MFKYNEKASQIFADLIEAGFLPEQGNFKITEELLYEYKIRYLAQQGLELDLNSWGSRKYAGSSLLSLKRSRGINLSGNRAEGYVYFIGNPSWPNSLKIGISSDYLKRLASYQTYSPNRDYYIQGWEFVTCKKDAEDLILNKFQIDTDKGEWVSQEVHLELIKYLRTHIKPIDIAILKRGNFKVGDIVKFKRPKDPVQYAEIVKFLSNNRVCVNSFYRRGNLNAKKMKRWDLLMEEIQLVQRPCTANGKSGET